MNVIYEVAAIVGRRVKKGKVEYRVRWKGFPPEEDTWEPSSCLRESCFQLIRMYNAEHRQKRELEQSVDMTGCTRSPSPSLHAETSPTKKPSPSVCSSDQLSLVSAANYSPRSASPLPHQSISPPITATNSRSATPSKPNPPPVKRSETPRPIAPLQHVSNSKTVKRSSTKASSSSGSSPTNSGGRKKVLVVFNSVSCDSPPPSETKYSGERQKRECYPLEKAASDPPKAMIQRETVKTVDITSSDRQYRDFIHHGASLTYPSTLKMKRGAAQIARTDAGHTKGFTAPAPYKNRKVGVVTKQDSLDAARLQKTGSVAPGVKKKTRKYERKRPYKRRNLKNNSKFDKPLPIKRGENKKNEDLSVEINHSNFKVTNDNVKRMKSGKKTQEYIRLKSKSLRKVDKNKMSSINCSPTSPRRIRAFRRVFEPPHHEKQLNAAMSGDSASRNLPVLIVYALDRIKKMKRKSDVENIHDVVSRMESDLFEKKLLIDETVTAMEKNGLLLRWEGSGSSSYRVSTKAVDLLNIDNSDGYLFLSGDKKSKLGEPDELYKFEKPKLATRKYTKRSDKFIKKEVCSLKEKRKLSYNKKDSIPVGKRKATNDLANSSKEMSDLVLPPPSAKRRKMVEESSEVSASSSSGPPTDASYQAKENKTSTHSTNSNVSASSQSLVNKACNIIENIQNKSKTNTHLYVVGKHVILLPPSANGNDPSMSKEMSNLPHRRFGANGSSNSNGQNGGAVQPENGSTGNGALTMERRISVRQTESAFRYKEITVKRQDNFVEIALQSNVGLMKNVFTMTTLQEISMALQSALHDCESRLVVITGTDFVFSHGVDLAYIANRRGSESVVRFAEAIRQFLITLVNFPKPVVAVLNGPAIGLGAALLPLCDIVYASDKAIIQLPYCYLGQTPEGGSSFTFPKVVGAALAADMFMSGRKLTAKEASDRGLISDVFWPSVLMLQTLARCRRIAQCPPKSLESTKCIIRSQQRERLIYAIESECSMLAECWEGSDCKQKIQEYLNSSLDSLL